MKAMTRKRTTSAARPRTRTCMGVGAVDDIWAGGAGGASGRGRVVTVMRGSYRQPCASTKAPTRCAMSSRMPRTWSSGRPFGSSSGQSSVRAPGTKGHWSAQPMVISHCACCARSSVSRIGFASVRSAPRSLHHDHHFGVDARTGIRPGRYRAGLARIGDLVEQRRRHLRAPGVVHAGEEHRGHPATSSRWSLMQILRGDFRVRESVQGRGDYRRDHGVGLRRQQVVHPDAFAARRHQTCAAEIGQMSRGGGLRLAQAAVEMADADLAVLQQRQDAKPRRIRQGAVDRGQGVEMLQPRRRFRGAAGG